MEGVGGRGKSPEVHFRRSLDERHRNHLYGRRRGHRLRPGRQRLVDDLLPRIAATVPDDGAPVDLKRLFNKAVTRFWLEIGFGAGEHLAAQAAAHPDVGIIGCEPFVNGVAALLARIEEGGLTNVRIRNDDARPLLAALPEAAFERVFVLFPDPWPKTRHLKRRFIGASTLDALARLMTDGAELRFASDDMDYVRWTLDHVWRHGAFAWTAHRPGDWRHRPPDATETRYEAKAGSSGATCVHLSFRRRPR